MEPKWGAHHKHQVGAFMKHQFIKLVRERHEEESPHHDAAASQLFMLTMCMEQAIKSIAFSCGSAMSISCGISSSSSSSVSSISSGCHSSVCRGDSGLCRYSIIVEVCNGKVSVKSLYTLLHSKEWLFPHQLIAAHEGFLRNAAACNIKNIQKRDQLPTHITTPPTTESPASMQNTTTNYIEGKAPTVMSCHNFRPTAVIMSHVMTQHRSSYTKS